MQMLSVRSETIDVIGYDAHNHRLRVCFRHAKPQDFCHVPAELFQAFLNARSKSRFFRRHIQDCFPS
ncbi:MAG: KTSC domain-containing protein [Methylomonas sp.]|nr:KTSC domain-containing protein [Methylomonas sp.]MBS3964760.1 KTSC domain-containing protein [Methylomonas sp.]PPD22636.1 MAG: KTSC domain-containing protein [Methylomonas sp.]PPD27948.1 MAG: KTSC domain-containing protein [Methylomonas sp.]PPD40057.1 MAG: KTSC domain-containing protein [Methylomonas sp.]